MRSQPDLSRAERRIAGRLLDRYPLSGLGPLSRLAQDSAVSAPTVLRLLSKLGFESFAEFREQVHGDIADLLTSGEPGGAYEIFAELTTSIFRSGELAVLDQVVDLLADCDSKVYVTGGSYSHLVATYLTMYLSALRPGVIDVPPEIRARSVALLDVDHSAVVVVIDYRQFQTQSIAFGRQAASRGAQLVLITDSPLSPLAPEAKVLVEVPARGPAPFSSMVGGFMVAEAIVGAVAERLGGVSSQRLREFFNSSDDEFGPWAGST